MSLILCPECNKEISDKVKSCPHCGYPFDDISLKNEPQKVEITSINFKPRNPRRIKTIIILILTLIVITAGILTIMFLKKIKREKEIYNTYIDNLKTISGEMLSGAGTAESICHLTAKVWQNTIYEESSYETDKYTQYEEKFTFSEGTWSRYNSDFNVSLSNLYTILR